MGNDCCKRAIVLTPKGEKYHNILVIFFFIDLVFLFIRIICGRYDGIFSTAIELLIFIMTFLTCHYIVAGFLVFFTLFDIFFTLLFLGQRLQNKIQNVNDTFLEKIIPDRKIRGIGAQVIRASFALIVRSTMRTPRKVTKFIMVSGIIWA